MGCTSPSNVPCFCNSSVSIFPPPPHPPVDVTTRSDTSWTAHPQSAMSDSDSGSSSSDGEDINTTGLIATRAKRSTAGNLYASLRANLDDEELQKELLAEDAEDVGDYEGEDREGEDDEEALDSSSDEEDAGPPGEGDAEELEGEKQLKKQERAEARKKRSLKDARLMVRGGGGRARKRVRLAEGVKGGDGEGEEVTAPKPKKKSERSNWLPTAEDGPVRQSGRALAVANREVVHANLKESAARSEKQRRVMKDAAERERSKKTRHADLTQEERLKRCERVEKETAKELGRFEMEEAERQRAREEALAAKRRRGAQGPVSRVWSGSCVWEGEKVKVGRVEHGSLGEEGLKGFGKGKAVEVEADGGAEGAVEKQIGEDVAMTDAAAASTTAANQGHAADAPVSWLQGIEQYAALPANQPVPPNEASSMPVNGFTPSAPATAPYSAPPYQALAAPPPQPTTIYHGWPPGGQSDPLSQQIPPAPPPAPVPAPPLIREQAQRTLLILEDFPELAAAPETTTKASKRKSLASNTGTSTSTSASKSDPGALETTFTPSAVQNLLLPESYPPLTPLHQTYLSTKPRKSRLVTETVLPSAPPKARCALTQWEAKFRDPKTGVPYADLHAYKALQRCLSGGCAWSGVLGAWVGAELRGSGQGGGKGRPMMGLGRAARGVPEGFAGGDGPVKVEAAA